MRIDVLCNQIQWTKTQSYNEEWSPRSNNEKCNNGLKASLQYIS
jgi:hypothetical protein